MDNQPTSEINTHESDGNEVNNIKRSACEACYVRKKRCVFGPQEQECTRCMKEGQVCAARERQTKSRKKCFFELYSTRHFPRDIKHSLKHEQTRDEEVPTWSPLHSFVLEAKRLLPEDFENNSNYAGRSHSSLQRNPAGSHTKDWLQNPGRGIRIKQSCNPSAPSNWDSISLKDLDALLQF